jgi:hypothetical protein
MNPVRRLLPATVPCEVEWKYLINETYIGERAIVSLLHKIPIQPSLSDGLRRALRAQLDDEVRHVRLYRELLGSEKLQGSGYDSRFKAYVETLPCITLKLFALQGLLEGIALGALEYRQANWPGSPSTAVDLSVQADEDRHVVTSFAFFKELKALDPNVTPQMFREVARTVNAIFADAFNGRAIARFMSVNFADETIDADSIEQGEALTAFRKKSAVILAANKKAFLDSYYAA